MKLISYLIISLLCLFPLACTQKSKKDFNPDLSAKLVKEGALLIDVRSSAEFKSKHISGAVHIPHTDIQSQQELLKKLTNGDKNKAIVLYCGSGKRAATAQKTLQSMGYTDVVNHGGINTWKNVP